MTKPRKKMHIDKRMTIFEARRLVELPDVSDDELMHVVRFLELAVAEVGRMVFERKQKDESESSNLCSRK